MIGYVVRRLLQVAPVVVLSALAVFLLMRLIPGDPALIHAGPDATPEVVAAVRRDLGLDRSWPVQFALWARQVATGNLGVSFSSKFPVSYLIFQALPATLELTLAAIVLALLIGIPSGIGAAARHGSALDGLITGATSFVLGIPNFWIGILLIILFSLVLGLLPPSGRVSLLEQPVQASKYLVMPALTLSLHVAAQLSRFTKAVMLDVLHENYIRTARAKGLAERVVLVRHAIRNSLIPVITVLGLQFGRLLGGAIVIESVFGWPGVGRVVLRAIGNRDYPVVQGVLLVFVTLTLVINMLTDLSYGLVDPRVRLGNKSDG